MSGTATRGDEPDQGRPWPPKNPINHGSRDPLHPPSNSVNYTLFTGIPISTLLKATEANRATATATSSAALAQTQPRTIACGSTRGVVHWKELFESENNAIKTLSCFGRALSQLRVLRPSAPYLHTNLHLQEWLQRLEHIGTAEAADGYWGVSRGLEVVPSDTTRAATATPNYYDQTHKELLRSEVKRIIQDGYLCTYADLKLIWPGLPANVKDTLGLGFVVKTNADGTVKKVRLIIDGSRPSGASVNDAIQEWSTALPTVFEFVRDLRQGDWLVSADIGDAYHNLGLQPDNWSNVTFKLATESDNEEVDLCYVRLAFGIRNAVRIFSALASLIKTMLQHECMRAHCWHAIRTHIAYIDDSAAIARTRCAALKWLTAWRQLMRALGLPWSEAKITEPSREMLLLGLLIKCASRPTVSVEQSRIDKALAVMSAFRTKGYFTLREAQSVMGTIAFINQVVHPGKVFNRGLALQTIKFGERRKKQTTQGSYGRGRFGMRIDTRVLADWSVLDAVFNSFNGVDASSVTHFKAAPAGPAQADASFWGCGTWVHGHYSRVVWADQGIEIFDKSGKPKVSTMYVEALGLRQLLRHNAKYWVERFIVINLDNTGLVASMRGERSKSEQTLPIILDCVSIIMAYAIKPKFETIGTDDMWFADPLSRFQHPTRGWQYRVKFAKRLAEWERYYTAWAPKFEQSRRPPVPGALSIRTRWEKARALEQEREQSAPSPGK